MKIGKALSFAFMCVAIAVAALAFYIPDWGPPPGSTTVASQLPAGLARRRQPGPTTASTARASWCPMCPTAH